MARRTVKEVSTDLDKFIDRLYDLEGAHTDLEMRHKLLHKDVVENTRDVSEIKDYFKWFMKVVIGLFASAVVAFIVQGGLV
jgi:uncharacterized phage infection (PIP) family protein YhgE